MTTPRPIALLNATVMPADGTWHRRTIPVADARQLIAGRDTVSHVGHDVAAVALARLLDPGGRLMFMTAFVLALGGYALTLAAQLVMASGPCQGWRRVAAPSLLRASVLVLAAAVILGVIAIIGALTQS